MFPYHPILITSSCLKNHKVCSVHFKSTAMDNKLERAGMMHAQINTWKETVRLVRDETKIFENQLQNITKHWTESEVLQYVQKFESQFIRQHEVCDELEHDLKIADHNLNKWMQWLHAGNVESAPDQSALEDKANTFEKLFMELRDEFRHFAAQLQNARSLN